MHYLFAIWDGGGTVPVELGIARRLLARGHRVTVLADPVLIPDVARAGAAFRPWKLAPHRDTADLSDDVLKDWECRNPIELFGRIRDRIITGPSAAYAADVRCALGEIPADAVIANGALLGALIGAESMDVPSAAVCPNVYLRSAPGMPPFGLGLKPSRGRPGRARDRLINSLIQRMWRTGLPDLNATRQSLALPQLLDPWQQWDHCARVIVTTAKAFDIPAQLPSNVSYVGPVLDDPAWAVTEPTDPTDRDDGRPLVVVGVSTTHVPGQADLLRRIVAAVDSLPLRGVVTTGPTIDPAEVPGTSSVRVVRSAAHSELFAQASAVVTHAGHGTIIKALAAGVPVLCIPHGRDQGDNAVRAVCRGVGIRLPRKASIKKIGSAVEHLVNDPGYAERARSLGAAIRAETDRSAMVAELEALAGSGSNRQR